MGVNNGKQGWAITCKSNGVGNFYERASNLCPGGLTEIANKGHSARAVAIQGIFIANSNVAVKVEYK